MKIVELLSSQVHDGWSYRAAVELCLSIVTTIGYGEVTPLSQGGRLFCCFYAVFGIPFFLVLLSHYGNIVANTIRRISRIVSKCAKKYQDKQFSEENNVTGSSENSLRNPEPDQNRCQEKFTQTINETNSNDEIFFIMMGLLVVYVVLWAALLVELAPTWSYVDAFYFCTVSITTIGFGDLSIPYSVSGSLQPFLASVSILMGLVLLSAFFRCVMGPVVRFLYLKRRTPMETFDEMKETYGGDSPSYDLVKRWHCEFKHDRRSVETAARPGCPSSAIDETSVRHVKAAILKDRHISPRGQD
ncbi:potassium channel subfamily K member 9-like [Saccoglossus kowalevskii]